LLLLSIVVVDDDGGGIIIVIIIMTLDLVIMRTFGIEIDCLDCFVPPIIFVIDVDFDFDFVMVISIIIVVLLDDFVAVVLDMEGNIDIISSSLL
jgi:hypothetical protein